MPTLLLFALAAGVLVAIPGPNHIYIVYALAAGALGGWLRGRPAFVRAQRYLTACIYLWPRGSGAVRAERATAQLGARPRHRPSVTDGLVERRV